MTEGVIITTHYIVIKRAEEEKNAANKLRIKNLLGVSRHKLGFNINSSKEKGIDLFYVKVKLTPSIPIKIIYIYTYTAAATGGRAGSVTGG